MSDRKYMVRKWGNNLKVKDIICLQEIKIVGFQVYTILKFIWDQSIGYYSNHPRGKGGIAILVGPQWAEKIISNNSSPCHRAMWVIFKHKDIFIGVCNIYAPNDYIDYVALWEWLSNGLPKAHWIFVGDFNMVENREDKSGGNVQCWKGNELFFWSNFKRKFRIADPLTLQKGSFSNI